MNHGPQLHGVVVGVGALALVGYAMARGVASVLATLRTRRRSDRPENQRNSGRSGQAAANRMATKDHGCGPCESRPAVATPGGAIVSVSGLTKRYGDFVAVDGLSFSLEPGTVTGFLGPNGAGKTTTLRMILGLAEPSAGGALVFGRRYAELVQPARRVGAVLESNDFHPGRSGRDHLRVLALAADLAPSRVDHALALVALGPSAGRPVKTYSLGMRQRLGLATALLGDPDLLILDEPANGLDPVGMHWLRSFLRGFAGGGGTVLVSSHVLAEVAQTVDRVVIIDHGRLVADAPLGELAGRGHSLEDFYLELTAGRAAS